MRTLRSTWGRAHLRTMLMTRASFSRPWKPSTVLISSVDASLSGRSSLSSATCTQHSRAGGQQQMQQAGRAQLEKGCLDAMLAHSVGLVCTEVACVCVCAWVCR